jgi:hypothetical protein
MGIRTSPHKIIKSKNNVRQDRPEKNMGMRDNRQKPPEEKGKEICIKNESATNSSHGDLEAVLLHQLLRTLRIIVNSNLRVQSSLLRNIGSHLNASESLLRFLRVASDRRTRRRQSLEVVVVVVALVTAADNRGKHLGVSIAGESTATGACWSRGFAAVAIAAG